MCKHVGLCKRSTLRPEFRPQVIEEPEVDVDALITRAVERANRRCGGSACRLYLIREERRLYRLICATAALVLCCPVTLDAVHKGDHAAVIAALGVGAGLAILCQRTARWQFASERLILEPCQAAQATPATNNLGKHKGDDRDDDPDSSSADGNPAGQPTGEGAYPRAPTLVINLRCIKRGIFVDIDHGSCRTSHFRDPGCPPCDERSFTQCYVELGNWPQR